MGGAATSRTELAPLPNGIVAGLVIDSGRAALRRWSLTSPARNDRQVFAATGAGAELLGRLQARRLKVCDRHTSASASIEGGRSMNTFRASCVTPRNPRRS
jgi:hypothetical protein